MMCHIFQLFRITFSARDASRLPINFVSRPKIRASRFGSSFAHVYLLHIFRENESHARVLENVLCLTFAIVTRGLYGPFSREIISCKSNSSHDLTFCLVQSLPIPRLCDSGWQSCIPFWDPSQELFRFHFSGRESANSELVYSLGN